MNKLNLVLAKRLIKSTTSIDTLFEIGKTQNDHCVWKKIEKQAKELQAPQEKLELIKVRIKNTSSVNFR
jgi:hypothetical protein